MSWALNPNRCRQGLSLLEVLVSLALMVLTLTITIQLMQRVFGYNHRLSQREQAVERAVVTWAELAKVCRQANRWHTPTISDSSTVTSLDIEVPDLSQEEQRWPWPPPTPGAPPEIWQPQDSSRQSRLHYFIGSQGLMRSLTLGGATQSQLWSCEILGLSLRRLGGERILLEISFLNGSATQTVSAPVKLPLKRSWQP